MVIFLSYWGLSGDIVTFLFYIYIYIYEEISDNYLYALGHQII